MFPHTFIVEHDWGYIFCETCKLTFSLAGRQFVVCKLALRAYWSPEVLAMYICMRENELPLECEQVNSFTAKFSQKQISTKFPNFIS